jgi:hypothetical protein
MSESQRRSHVHILHSVHYKGFTGQDPNHIIKQSMFVEQETNWQKGNSKQEKLPSFYNNL